MCLFFLSTIIITFWTLFFGFVIFRISLSTEIFNNLYLTKLKCILEEKINLGRPRGSGGLYGPIWLKIEMLLFSQHMVGKTLNRILALFASTWCLFLCNILTFGPLFWSSDLSEFIQRKMHFGIRSSRYNGNGQNGQKWPKSISLQCFDTFCITFGAKFAPW